MELVCGKTMPLFGKRRHPGDIVGADEALKIPNLQVKIQARLFYIKGTEPKNLQRAVPGDTHRTMQESTRPQNQPDFGKTPQEAAAPKTVASPKHKGRKKGSGAVGK